MSKTGHLCFYMTEKVLKKKGGRTRLNTQGSTRNLTSLIDKDLLFNVK